MKTPIKFDSHEDANLLRHQLVNALAKHFAVFAAIADGGLEDDHDRLKFGGAMKGLHFNIVNCYHDARLSVSGLWPRINATYEGAFQRYAPETYTPGNYCPRALLEANTVGASGIMCAVKASPDETVEQAAQRIAKQITSRFLSQYHALWAVCDDRRIKAAIFCSRATKLHTEFTSLFEGVSGVNGVECDDQSIRLTLSVSPEKARAIAAILA